MAALAVEALLSALDFDAPGVASGSSGDPSLLHVLSLFTGLALLSLTPRLWRGTRTALTVAIVGLVLLAGLDVLRGHGYGEALVELGLAVLLGLGRGAFRLGCRNRPRAPILYATAGAWCVAFLAIRVAPLVSGAAGRVLHGHGRAPAPRLTGDWRSLVEVLTAFALASTVLALRSLLRARAAPTGHDVDEELAARDLIARHGEDSLSPFILRPDKALHFAAGGVLSYAVIGETAVVSSDPVAPPGRAAAVLESFRERARDQGWEVVVWAASASHLASYESLGLRALCAGEEAVVKPAGFGLEGRRVRKLRQSVHRLGRRGWEISVHEGREVDGGLERELEALEARWREAHPRLLGFAMGMGSYESELRADDVFVIGRAPDGELRAAMRFAAHRGKWSLDTMHRLGETPNGLNEAMVCRALGVARGRSIPEVSLNYAGLAHLLRGDGHRRRLPALLARATVPLLARRFQLDRLVRFNQKFSPQWRPRYLVYESTAALPRSVLRVLQAEGYLGRGPALRRTAPPLSLPRLRARSAQAKGTG